MRGLNIGLKALLLGWCLIPVSCGQKSGKQPPTQKDTTHTQLIQESVRPADFAFILTDIIDSVSSKDASLTRRYVYKDSCVTFPLSQQEMNLIYQAYLAHGLDKLDPDFYLDCYVNVMPSIDTEITLVLDGKIKQYTYNSNFECADKVSTRYVEQIGDFLSFVEGIIYKKEAVRKLSRTDMVFM
jgi:hypothetical protein